MEGADTDSDSVDDLHFTYDAIGRRVSRNDGTTNTIFVSSGQQVIAEYLSGSQPTSPTRTNTFTHRTSTKPLIKIGTGGTLYYHPQPPILHRRPQRHHRQHRRTIRLHFNRRHHNPRRQHQPNPNHHQKQPIQHTPPAASTQPSTSTTSEQDGSIPNSDVSQTEIRSSMLMG